MATTKRAKAAPEFWKHAKVAELFGITPRTLRAWVLAGDFPQPHMMVRQTWFYDATIINHWRQTGQWPDRAKFRPKPRTKV